MVEFETADVVVIGGGSAAHEAAIAAKTAGADRVVMLEKAPESQAGGNARYSGTGFRFTFEPDDIAELCDLTPEEFGKISVEAYSGEDFLSDLNRVTQGRIDPELADVLVSDSNAAVRWTKEVGLTWEVRPGITIDGIRHFSPGIPVRPLRLRPDMTNGLSQLIQWDRIGQALGIDRRYESKVIGFLGDETGIDGVRVSGPDGPYQIRAEAVIACAGGFQANPQMRAKYLGPNADIMKVRGSRHDTGEVLQMLLDLGAEPAGQWQGAHVSPIDASAGLVESGEPVNRYSYCWGITVNQDAQRFIDEGEAEVSYTYAKTGWAIQRQPGATAYQIGDQQVWDSTREAYRPTEAIWADSIEDLARRAGLNPTVLAETIRSYNDAVDTAIEFDPVVRDGRRTNGLVPDKTNWARRIDTPPYYAGQVTGGITFTFGGVKINADAQVVAVGGRPIPRLYASGDILGLFFHNYPAMTGQTRNLVFGLRAGRNAAGLCAGIPRSDITDRPERKKESLA